MRSVASAPNSASRAGVIRVDLLSTNGRLAPVSSVVAFEQGGHARSLLERIYGLVGSRVASTVFSSTSQMKNSTSFGLAIQVLTHLA